MINFMECLRCGNIIMFLEKRGPIPSCCGEPMITATVHTNDGPSEKHVPVIKIITAMEGGELIRMVSVEIGEVKHPMDKDHYIKWIILETNKGIHLKRLTFGQNPSVNFTLTNDENPISAYAYCNIHGIWMKDA